jgi:dTDP-glucose 4,6-dehydratase
VLDALTYAGNLASLRDVAERPSFRFVHGDIGDRPLAERLLREEGITLVVNFAAESHVDRSIRGPERFIATNVVGTHTLLQAVRQVWLEERGGQEVRFHHTSTDEVYGSLEPGDAPCSESRSYAPNSPYAASKAASDHLVRAYHRTYGLPVTTSNCSNNYGPYQFPEKLIPLMLTHALEGKSLPVYGNGTNVRDWLHVTDHCRALELVLLDGRIGETYNVAGGNQWTNLDLVRLLCRSIDAAFRRDPALAHRFPRCPTASGGSTEALVSFVADRPGHDRRYALDGGKIERELGFRPSVSVENGIAQTLDWYLGNEAWWRAVMDGSYRDWLTLQYGPVTRPPATERA